MKVKLERKPTVIPSYIPGKPNDLPFFLETPNELDGYAAEIALLKSWRED